MSTEAFALESKQAFHGDAIFGRQGTNRFRIRRWWVDEPKRWAAWLMLNPSNAGADTNDPTALRVTDFTRSWGYDGWIGVNIYPFITSDPREMWKMADDWENNGPDWYARDDMHENLSHVEEAGRAACLRMVAFGAEAIKHDDMWLYQCIEDFMQPFDRPDRGLQYDERLFCLGLTANGQPIHPLARGKHRVPNDAKPMLWKA